MSEFEPIEDARAGCGKAVLKALVALGVILLLFNLAGCRQVQTVVAPEAHNSYSGHDGSNTHKVRDSIFIKETVVIREKGDTVYKDSVHVEYKWKLKCDSIEVRDSIYIHDSIPYPVEVPKYVRQRNGYDRFTAAGFWVFVALIAIALAVWIVKKIYLKR